MKQKKSRSYPQIGDGLIPNLHFPPKLILQTQHRNIQFPNASENTQLQDFSPFVFPCSCIKMYLNKHHIVESENKEGNECMCVCVPVLGGVPSAEITGQSTSRQLRMLILPITLDCPPVQSFHNNTANFRVHASVTFLVNSDKRPLLMGCILNHLEMSPFH